MYIELKEMPDSEFLFSEFTQHLTVPQMKKFLLFLQALNENQKQAEDNKKATCTKNEQVQTEGFATREQQYDCYLKTLEAQLQAAQQTLNELKKLSYWVMTH